MIPLIQANSSNYQTGRTAVIQYIVIHYTGNTNDTARNNCKYFQTGGRKASAHYFVDENEIIQSVLEKDTAWAVGDGNGKYGITNVNSLSIEMCNFLTYNETVANRTIAFVQELLQKYPNAQIVRHYDASRKLCPKPLVDDVEWAKFKNKITGGLSMTQYEELNNRLKEVESQAKVQWGYVDENMPEWAREPIQYLRDQGVLTGDENGNLQLNYTELRTFVILSRIMQKLSK